MLNSLVQADGSIDAGRTAHAWTC